MKAIVLNASPRKNWNTAQLLKAARQGAEEAGAETEYIDLYDRATCSATSLKR